MNFKIKIPVFTHTPETIEQEKTMSNLVNPDYFVPIDDLEIEDAIFYRVDYLYKFIENKNYTIIGSGSTSFVSPLSIKAVEEIIDKHLSKIQ